MDLLIIIAAKYLIALPVLVLAWYLWALPAQVRKPLALLSVVSLPISYLLGLLAGVLHYSARPFVVEGTIPLVTHVANNGFPSDHTLLAATLAMIVWTHNRTLGALMWLVAVIIGAARVLAGVHHMLDIIASMIIAAVAVEVVHRVLMRRHQ